MAQRTSTKARQVASAPISRRRRRARLWRAAASLAMVPAMLPQQKPNRGGERALGGEDVPLAEGEAEQGGIAGHRRGEDVMEFQEGEDVRAARDEGEGGEGEIGRGEEGGVGVVHHRVLSGWGRASEGRAQYPIRRDREGRRAGLRVDAGEGMAGQAQGEKSEALRPKEKKGEALRPKEKKGEALRPKEKKGEALRPRPDRDRARIRRRGRCGRDRCRSRC